MCSLRGVNVITLAAIFCTRCSQRYRNTILNSKVYPGADCSSDHYLVVTRLIMRMKNIKKKKPVG